MRIRAGDVWKTAFSTTSGHYSYTVMPYALVNAPSFFQSFINDVFCNMLNKYLVVYLNDIISCKYWWPKVREDVERVVRSCSICAITKVPRQLLVRK